MEGSREIKISFEKFIKRSWPILVFGGVLLVVTSVLLFIFAVSGKGRKQVSNTENTVTDTPATTDEAILIPRNLDGVLVAPEEARLQPYAVMVENHVDARPLSGPALANLVFEIPVEGGITRYLLVFDATTTVQTIGPVRSARPYFVDFADGLNAVYTHVGGSPEALEMISGLSSFRDLNEFFNGRFFWRSAKRTAPHNVFTSTDLLHEAALGKKWTDGHFRPWSYKDDDPFDSTTSTNRGSENGPKLTYGGSYSVSWTYDRETNSYKRTEGEKKQLDQDGSQVTAKNIVVLQTDGSVIDSEGRLKIRTTGRGKATLYRDGRSFEVSWFRASGEHIKIESIDGKEADFNRGTTWVEVMLNTTSATSTTSTTPTE
ncbi:MAG: DUF3048 domain-containing protein [Patescibacteria group bacterium]